MRESERRFQVMAETTPSLAGDPKTGFGDSWSEYVHPDDLDSVLSANASALAKRVSFSKGGVGFEVEEAKRNRGLGLVSMQERVHLVHGTFFVESAPGKGTKILAAVPLVEGDGSAAAGDEPAAITGAA
jgi:hypothetical protein